MALRVAHVTPVFGGAGGVEDYVLGLAHGLTELGVEVRVLAGGAPPEHGGPTDGLAVSWFPRRRVGRYELPRGLARAVVRAASWADVVHAHQPFAVGTLLSRAASRHFALSPYLHEVPQGAWTGLRRKVQLRSMIRGADLVVSVSQSELHLIRSIAAPRQSVVVWPGLDGAGKGDLVGGLPSNGTLPVVVTLSRLVAHKQVDRAIEAVGLAGGFRLRVIGDGPQRHELERLCRDLAFDSADAMPGTLTRSEVWNELATAAVFVSLSTEESFGMSLLQAAAAGCHLVVSDIPSHREIVTALDCSATLVRPGAPSAEVAQALRHYRDHERPVAPHVPTWTDQCDMLRDAYEGLLH